jgi:glycosyltransferase involved in cell wall biosynthesis
MEASWKALSASLGISHAVYWPGFLDYDSLPSAYQRAGAFVHPARREAWGLVVNEAAAAGLPLIVGRRVGAAAELIREGENGFLVDPDDTAAFADVLLGVATASHSERAAMGAASRRIVSDFGVERFGQGLRRCLAE